MCGVSVVCKCEVCEECVYIHIYTCCVYICGVFLMLCIHMVYDCVFGMVCVVCMICIYTQCICV